MGNDYYQTFANDYHDFPISPSIGEEIEEKTNTPLKV